MKFKDVMAYYDYRMKNIIKALHVAPDTVTSWKRKDKIPFSKQCELEVLSEGKLKAKKEDA